MYRNIDDPAGRSNKAVATKRARMNAANQSFGAAGPCVSLVTGKMLLARPKTIPCAKCRRLFDSVEARDQHVKATHADPSWEAGKANVKFRKAPICPVCAKPAQVTATKYGPRAGCCGLHSWDLKPLVSPAVHDARKLAHATFDPVWRSGDLSRGEAYRRLALAMGIPQKSCHISLMTDVDAARVVEIVRSGALREGEPCNMVNIGGDNEPSSEHD